MVFALVGDSTITSEPLPLPFPAGADSAAPATTAAARRFAGALVFAVLVFFFTTVFLAATRQPFVKIAALGRRLASLPSCLSLRKSHDLRAHLRRRLFVGLHFRVGLEVRGLPLLEELAHLLRRVLSH